MIFTETLQQESPRAEQLPYYMDEDEEERYPGVDELFATESLSKEQIYKFVQTLERGSHH